MLKRATGNEACEGQRRPLVVMFENSIQIQTPFSVKSTGVSSHVNDDTCALPAFTVEDVSCEKMTAAD